MKPRTFLIQGQFTTGETVTVTGALFRHMATVLRLRTGMPVRFVDGIGCGYAATISAVEKETLFALIEGVTPAAPKEKIRITLLQGLPRGEKMDLIVQKATELGVSRIVPVVCTRSVARPDGTRSASKVSRWSRITEEAARQCGRGTPPHVPEVLDFREAIFTAPEGGKVMLWEEERACGLKSLIPQLELPGEITLLVGPEGGLTPEEAAFAKENGFISAGLGPRVLRTETAAIAALTLIQFIFGDLGEPAGGV
jgi:16S rRNA (uracil1498-N3)-methyltransferase